MTSDLGTEAAGHAREARESRSVRRARGIVHTPRELAQFALHQVDVLLRNELGVSLADERVRLLDPAVGPGVWLEAALAHVPVGSARRTWLGFDVDADVLETARSLLTPACESRGIELRLTNENTLALPSPWQDEGVRVIVGNPPWAARSLSRGAALSDLWLRDFHRDHADAPLDERRTGVLSDDYVRFYRWALEQARTSPAGAVVCFATNSSFLDGPVHRGMRARLLETFSQVSVLDLGGNALLSRHAATDENLFGVRVGAALVTLLKRENRASASIHYGRLSGTREGKLARLNSHDAMDESVGFTPAPPQLRFVPGARAVVVPGFRLDEAFPFHREGVQTNRDELVTADDRAQLLGRLHAIADGTHPLTSSRHFSPERARARLAEALATRPEDAVRTLAYRPFEQRFVCVVSPLCHRPRPDLARAVSHAPWCLLSARKDRGALPFHLFAAATDLADACFLSVRSSCRTRVFPSHGPGGEENLAPGLRDALEQRLGLAVSSDDVLGFSLATLASATYRERAGDALKHDYPRIAWPRDAAAFLALAQAGRAVRDALVAPPPRLGIELSGEPAYVVRLRDVQLAPAEGRLTAGDARIEGVPTRAFSACVGHWSVMPSWRRSTRTCSLSYLLDMVRRVAVWDGSVARADALFADHASL